MSVPKKKNIHNEFDENSNDTVFNDENYEYSHEKKKIKSNRPVSINPEKVGRENVIAFKNGHEKEISRSELKSLLEKNKDVEEITIESLKFDQANRYKINFNAKDRANNAKMIKHMERVINSDFLDLSFEKTEELSSESEAMALKLLESSKENVVIDYEKHSLKRKSAAIDVEEIYYSIENHKDLYHLGKSYLEDLGQGKKCFGLCSVDQESSSIETMVGLSSYFSYHTNLNCAVIMDLSSGLGPLEKHIPPSELEKNKSYCNKIGMSVFRTDLMDIFDLNKLDDSDSDVKNTVKKIYNDYDVIIVVLPKTKSIDERRNIFFPLVYVLDNVNLITKMKKTKYKLISGTLEYFHKYDVSIKGVMF